MPRLVYDDRLCNFNGYCTLDGSKRAGSPHTLDALSEEHLESRFERANAIRSKLLAALGNREDILDFLLESPSCREMATRIGTNPSTCVRMRRRTLARLRKVFTVCEMAEKCFAKNAIFLLNVETARVVPPSDVWACHLRDGLTMACSPKFEDIAAFLHRFSDDFLVKRHARTSSIHLCGSSGHDGSYRLDRAVLVADRNAAIALAQREGQAAIFHVRSGQVLNLRSDSSSSGA